MTLTLEAQLAELHGVLDSTRKQKSALHLQQAVGSIKRGQEHSMQILELESSHESRHKEVELT